MLFKIVLIYAQFCKSEISGQLKKLRYLIPPLFDYPGKIQGVVLGVLVGITGGSTTGIG